MTGALSQFMLLIGMVLIRFRYRLRKRWATSLAILTGLGLMALSLTVLRDYELPARGLTIIHSIQVAGMVAICLLLMPELRRQPQPVQVLATLAGLMPLVVNQVSFLMPHFNLDASVMSRMAVLRWFAYLIPLMGLAIDLARGAALQIQAREQAYLRRVIDALPDLVYARDRDGRYNLLNEAAARFMGSTREDLEGRLVDDLNWGPELTERLLNIDQRILERGRRFSHPGVQFQSAEGEPRWLQILSQPLVSGDGSVDQVLGVATDVTRLKNAEQMAEQQLKVERTLRLCLANLVRSPAGNFEQAMESVLAEVGRFCGADSVFIYQNDLEAGVSRQVCSWQNGPTPIQPTHNLRNMTWALDDLVRGETVVYADPEQLPENQPEAIALARELGVRFLMLAPVFDSDGKLWGILGAHCTEPPQPDCLGCRRVLASLADLYAQARSRFLAEASLTKAKEAAEASSTAKSEFLANMSHEIRTPLNAVIGLSDILRGLEPNPEQARYLQMIHHAGESLLGIINDILDFSKIEAGQFELDEVELDLPTLLSEVVDMMAYHAQQQGLELVYHLEPSARLQTTADPVRLKQILLNLLNNAIKFTENGHVALRVNHVDGLTQFTVTDSGIGIPPHQIDHIFDKFTQADASHTRKYGGTGLGLAICSNLVRMMDGNISVESTVGHGTSFTVSLPLKGEVPSSRSLLPDPLLQNLRHLVVMPDPTARKVVKAYLHDLGLEGDVTGDAVEAGDLLKSRSYDVALIDGQFDSILLERILDSVQSQPAADRPHMIQLTPIGDHRDAEDLSGDGWDVSLHKPVYRRIIRKTLRRLQSPDQTPQVETQDNLILSQSRRVLLVEDNLFNQKVALRLLENLGCQVVVADNGKKAVDIAGGQDFDLVLMDCQMPIMDGLEATRQIRALDGTRARVPVVAMTANVLGEHRDACLECGMDDFASKPVNKKTLREIIEKWSEQESPQPV